MAPRRLNHSGQNFRHALILFPRRDSAAGFICGIIGNMSPERQIFLTDKNGICKEKSGEISAIRFNASKQMWEVRFRNSGQTYFYRPENVRIVKNCLAEKASGSVYDYLLETAAFSEIENSSGDNLLVKTLERNRIVDSNSALALYLNPGKMKARQRPDGRFLFPFGCNNSQYKAVAAALGNRITVIQGPPGTGKTQTILNIVANLLAEEKTVLIVSNNNAATENVFEKLAAPECGLPFLTPFWKIKADRRPSFFPECRLFPKTPMMPEASGKRRPDSNVISIPWKKS